jgi:hypothetical protein
VVTEEKVKVDEEVKPSVQCSVHATKPSAKACDARESNTLQQKQSKKQKVNRGATKQETHQRGKNRGTETVDKLTELFRFMDLEVDEESQPGKDDDAFVPVSNCNDVWQQQMEGDPSLRSSPSPLDSPESPNSPSSLAEEFHACVNCGEGGLSSWEVITLLPCQHTLCLICSLRSFPTTEPDEICKCSLCCVEVVKHSMIDEMEPWKK